MFSTLDQYSGIEIIAGEPVDVGLSLTTNPLAPNPSSDNDCSGDVCPLTQAELDKLFNDDPVLTATDPDCLGTAIAESDVGFEVLRSQIGPSCAIAEPLPKTVPLCINLGPNLSDPAEKACAEAVARQLSSECDRVVSVADLDGLVLFLWSVDETDGIPISDYLSESRPLHGVVLESRGHASAEARKKLGIGRSFVVVAA